MASPQVSFIRPEVEAMLPIYTIVEDCISQKVKLKTDTYLPRPSPEDTSVENTERYTAYHARAIFYEVTGRTLGGLVGQVFSNDPEIKLPASLEVVQKDANGDGLSLTQSAKDATRRVVAYGRAGLYVDYPI